MEELSQKSCAAHTSVENTAATKILVVGNICAGKTTLGQVLASQLGITHVGIDDCRRLRGDGSASGEAAAWALFLARAADSQPAILDCSGSGPFIDLLTNSLHRSGQAVAVIWVDTPLDVCLLRAAHRRFDTPYPDFGVPMADVIRQLHDRLQCELPTRFTWPMLRVDGCQSIHDALDTAIVTLKLVAPSCPTKTLQVAQSAEQLISELIAWARMCPNLIDAVLLYGSAARGSLAASSDLDVALLLAEGFASAHVLTQAEALWTDRVRGSVATENGRTLWIGPELRRIDLLCVSDPDQFSWIADAPDVPVPRLRIVLDQTTGARASALQSVVMRAALTMSSNSELRSQRAKEEFDKFTSALDAAIRALCAGDQYATYFQHGLALHRLARVAELLYGAGHYLYSPRTLLDKTVPKEVAEGFLLSTATLDSEESQRLRHLVDLARTLASESLLAFGLLTDPRPLWQALIGMLAGVVSSTASSVG